MKTTFVILLISIIGSARAENYYFSGVSGNDSRTSEQAQNPATPWKTLSKLNSFFRSLNPGDSVLLKRGETFYGSIIVNSSGSSGSPIVIGAFGTGNKPVITGAQELSSWVSKGNGIYESYNSALGSTLNMVLLNGVEQQVGRYPNYDAVTGGYLYFESHSGTTSITDKELSSAINWTGAELAIRQRHWIINRVNITSHSKTTIKHVATSGEPYDNYGYFIQNSVKTLDKLGEWYYNPSTKKLSVYFGSSSPSSNVVEAAAVKDIIFSNDFSNVVFSNLAIKGANENGVDIDGGSNISVDNCDILFSGIDAVYVNNHDGFHIENSLVSNSHNNGINLRYGEKAVVRNNKVINTSTIAGMGLGGEGNGIAIGTRGDGNIIEYNEVLNTGYIPISFSGNDVTIKNNFIDTYCYIKDDGAGIYTNGGGNNTKHSGRKVIGNIVMNGLGAGYGTNIVTTNTAQGIYMDCNSSGVEIRNNTVVNAARALYLHNANNIIVNNNTFYNTSQQMYMNEDPQYGLTRSNSIINNIFFSKRPTSMVATIKSSKDDVSLFGKFDSNYYARPLNDRLVIAHSYTNKSGVLVTQSLDLESWQDKYNKDAKSKRTAKQIEPYKLNDLVGSNKVTNTTLSTLSGIFTSSCTISLSTSGLLDGSSLQVSPLARSSSVHTKVGSVTAGKNYILKYSVRGSVDSTQAISTYLRQGNSPYNNITSAQGRKVSVSRTNVEVLFSPTSSESSASVVFQVDDKNKYYLDNIQFYEADAEVTNIDDSMRFEYNGTNERKTISLDGKYIDVRNKSYSGSIVLEPYSSAILLKIEGNSDVEPEAPTGDAPIVSITSPSVNTSFDAGETISFNAVASDPGGKVKKVEFYNGNTLVKIENYAPYTYDWRNAQAGTFTITARATDDDGLVTTSAGVSVTVKNQTSNRGGVSLNSENNGIPKVSDMHLFPNPASNFIQLRFENVQSYQKANLSIIDLSGRVLKSMPVVLSGNNIRVDVASLPYGTYIMRISNENFSVNKKFAKLN